VPQLTYQRTVVGYHGCDQAIADSVLAGRLQLRPSSNRYDWLGQGVYFWEHGPQRAYDWAVEQASRFGEKLTRPAVLGSRIDLGVCLDLLDTANRGLLAKRYFQFRNLMRRYKIAMPRNRDAPSSRRGEKILRFRDCAILDFTVDRFAAAEGIRFQTVRGVFLEGPAAFPGSKIALKSHIQIAIRDSVCILELFRANSEDYQRNG
jgi:hypothetical protein